MKLKKLAYQKAQGDVKVSSNFEFWGWEKKPRTMLRFIKPGDIFCFKLSASSYVFGRVISKIMTGHVVEILGEPKSCPEVNDSDILSFSRKVPPFVLDSYSLFDRKLEGEWRVVGRQNNFAPEKVGDVYFTYGMAGSCKKVNVFGEEHAITEKESKKIPLLSSMADEQVKEILKMGKLLYWS